MNIYVLLRVILHSLLAVTNLLALTAAAWSISVSKGEGQPRASPGAVLVIIGSIAFVILCSMAWAELCIPRTLLSRVRTEITMVPMLIVFQLLAAAVATSNVVQSVCHDPTSCTVLLVLSWIAPLSLVIYYLVIMAIIFDHAKADPGVWDASPYEHPWFFRPLPPPSKEPDVASRRPRITGPLTLRTQPSVIPEHRRQRSSWMPPASAELSGTGSLGAATGAATAAASTDTLPSLHSEGGSARSLYVPQWAKNLKPVQRGLQLPFPVHARYQTHHRDDSRSIDAPVTPSIYTEYA